MVYKILQFEEWAKAKDDLPCKVDMGPCSPGRAQEVCVMCYSDYVDSCMSRPALRADISATQQKAGDR